MIYVFFWISKVLFFFKCKVIFSNKESNKSRIQDHDIMNYLPKMTLFSVSPKVSKGTMTKKKMYGKSQKPTRSPARFHHDCMVSSGQYCLENYTYTNILNSLNGKHVIEVWQSSSVAQMAQMKSGTCPYCLILWHISCDPSVLKQ